MKDEINKIAAVMGLKGEYRDVPVVCPWPTTFGIPGFIPCQKEKCKGYITQRLLTKAEMTDMMPEIDTDSDTIVSCKYCGPFEMDLPVILERVRV